MNMKLSIEFASQQDMDEVQTLLEDVGLGLSGDIEDHAVLRAEGVVCAAGKLHQTKINSFHLEVIGVRNEYHGDGLGTLFLSLLTSAPWDYCHPMVLPVTGDYEVTCVAKGDAVHFYKKMGFEVYSFSGLAAKYSEQCDNCPDLATCRPLPMFWAKVKVRNADDRVIQPKLQEDCCLDSRIV
jgi:N-acetylglutamate synthase-like GNAT family acetyltransferase